MKQISYYMRLRDSSILLCSGRCSSYNRMSINRTSSSPLSLRTQNAIITSPTYITFRISAVYFPFCFFSQFVMNEDNIWQAVAYELPALEVEWQFFV